MIDTQNYNYNKIRKDFAEVINRHSLENLSDTPDFVLAQLVLDAIIAHSVATRRRTEFYGYAR